MLVDEQFGGDIPKQGKSDGLKLAMPVEKSGQDEFDFEYGEQFGDHIEQHDPDFSKVLVRLNPDKEATAIMSLPRDLKVEIPGVGVDKINAVAGANIVGTTSTGTGANAQILIGAMGTGLLLSSDTASGSDFVVR